MARTIDMTPTWAAAVEIYLLVLENPNASPEGRDAARDEIRRLARAFDELNEKPATWPTGKDVIEYLERVNDPAANDEESDSARWRAERRLERLEERDELDLY
jgi:hypothetical protein